MADEAEQSFHELLEEIEVEMGEESSSPSGEDPSSPNTSSRGNPWPEVYKVIGAPGTGKTTRVVGNPELEDHKSLVQENLRDYNLGEQMIVTYTRSATEEAAERLAAVLDKPKTHIEDRVTTIHSQAFQTTKGEDEEVVQWYNKQNFCEAHDLNFGYDDDDGDLMGNDKDEGNAFFDIYSWLQSNLVDYEDWEDCPADDPGIGDVDWYCQRWDEWKSDNDLVGFGDMIVRAVKKARSQVETQGYGIQFPDDSVTDKELFEEAANDPAREPEDLRGVGAFVDTKVMYVDEVQDLTPLQWNWYLAQKLVCEKVYIGGDDDQTIYGWAGADPSFMLNEEGDFEVLDQTYRIPANIWEVCDTTIRRVDKRQNKDVTPHGDGGEFVVKRSPSMDSIIDYLESGDVFVLFRARFMIDQFREKLHEHGIQYRNDSTFDTWTGNMTELAEALHKIESSEGKITMDELEALREEVPNKMVTDVGGANKTERVLNSVSKHDPEQIKDMFSFPGSHRRASSFTEYYLQFADDINYYEQNALKGYVFGENQQIDPEDITLGTIHSAKGREAETVIVATDTTNTILEGMREDTRGNPDKHVSDAERRVYYVGMTRASDTLLLVEGLVSDETVIPVEHLITEEYVGEDHDETKGYAQSRLNR